MKYTIANKLIQQIPEGKEFLQKFPEYDLLIRKINIIEINRIQMEYPGFFPFETLKTNEEFSLLLITIISKKIGINGYPKCKIYLKIKNLSIKINEVKDLGEIEIVRVLTSKT